jgi:hypothetical protein
MSVRSLPLLVDILYMNIENLLQLESLGAQGTLVRTLIGMQRHMSLQIFHRCEALVATWMRA